jgi:predicted DCC family thiol-disulfide oxidoreductase YuxK
LEVSHRSPLPDPDQTPGSTVVIFDGLCGFCQGQVERLRRLDWGHRLSFISLHDPRVQQRYPQLAADDLMRQMYVIGRSGEAYGGADAIRYLSRRLPTLWIAAPILHVPGTRGIQQWVYQQIAQRRYQLSGANCANGHCRIPPR